MDGLFYCGEFLSQRFSVAPTKCLATDFAEAIVTLKLYKISNNDELIFQFTVAKYQKTL